MKKLPIFLLALLFLFSCKINNNINIAENANIPFKMAENYFVKNSQIVSIPTEKVITSKLEFDKIFHAAAYMGKNGMPTKIDFSKEQVLAIMLPVTNISKEIVPVKLVSQKSGEANFYYEIKSGEKLGFEAKPSALFIVSKEIKKIRFNKSN